MAGDPTDNVIIMRIEVSIIQKEIDIDPITVSNCQYISHCKMKKKRKGLLWTINIVDMHMNEIPWLAHSHIVPQSIMHQKSIEEANVKLRLEFTENAWSLTHHWLRFLCHSSWLRITLGNFLLLGVKHGIFYGSWPDRNIGGLRNSATFMFSLFLVVSY